MGRPGLNVPIRSGRCEIVAIALALIAAAVLSAIALIDAPLAARLTVENGVVEWLQVILYAGAALLFELDLVCNARETGRVSPLELAIVAGLIGLIMGEVDLDRLLFGTRIVSTRLFLDTHVAMHWRALAVLVVVGVPAALGVFVVARFGAFWREGCAAVAQSWGRHRE